MTAKQPKKELRPHQIDAVNAARESLLKGEIPYLDCCVSFGKSLVFAHITNAALNKDKRVLQITPTQELCKQNFDEAFGYIDDPHKLGMVCSGLNKNQITKPAIICTYGSFVAKRAYSGGFDLVLIDECHITSNDSDTSIRKIIKSLLRINPKMQILGASGSPYRMGQGALENDCVKGTALFTECAYRSNIGEMIKLGYLSHIKSISGDIHADLTDLGNGNSSDYNTKIMGVKFGEIISHAVSDIQIKFTANNIETAVIFASTVENAKQIVKEWTDKNNIKLLHGETLKTDRIEILEWLQNGNGCRYVVNVGILTTGFNFPALDCIVLLRATKSLSLYIQMVGRVIRAYTCENGIEKIGLVIDYGSNIDRHGAIDNVVPQKAVKKRSDAPKKLCDIILDETIKKGDGLTHHKGQSCNTLNILSAKKCSTCGAEFVIDNITGNYSMRSRAEILQAKIEAKIEEHEVDSVVYEYATDNYDDSKMIKMIFFDEEVNVIHKHKISLEHSWASKKLAAKKFMMKLFKDPQDFYKLGTVGISVKNMLPLLQNHQHFFKQVGKITIAPGKNGKYKELKKMVFKQN